MFFARTASQISRSRRAGVTRYLSHTQQHLPLLASGHGLHPYGHPVTGSGVIGSPHKQQCLCFICFSFRRAVQSRTRGRRCAVLSVAMLYLRDKTVLGMVAVLLPKITALQKGTGASFRRNAPLKILDLLLTRFFTTKNYRLNFALFAVSRSWLLLLSICSPSRASCPAIPSLFSFAMLPISREVWRLRF